LDFSCKNLGVDLYDCFHYLVDCLMLILIAQKEKRIGTCELIWQNWFLVVPDFSQYIYKKYKLKWYDLKFFIMRKAAIQ